MSRKSGALTYPEPFGPPRPVVGDLYLYYVTGVGGIMKIFLCVCQYELNRPTFVLFGDVTDVATACGI